MVAEPQDHGTQRVRDAPDIGTIELRTIPRMRVARCFFQGRSQDLGPMLLKVEEAARTRGVGPVGVSIIVFPAHHTADMDPDGRVLMPTIHAELRVPVSNTAALVPGEDGAPDVEFVRVDRFLAACRLYSGPVGGALREAQEEMFAWIDKAGLLRHSTRHHHAWMPNVRPGEITLEIRVPVAPRPPLQPAP